MYKVCHVHDILLSQGWSKIESFEEAMKYLLWPEAVLFMNEGEKFDWLQQRLNVLETKQHYSSRKHAMCGHAS